MCTKYTAYLRVSTDRQGKSGLGLEAQQAAVEAFVAGRGADARLLQSFTEVESGKHADRPELARAMEHARLTGSTLLIAKLDRLSRDAHFLIGLQKSGVAFTACDMPYADQFTVGIMALVAQKEREMISERTKAALQVAKARDTRLGNPRLAEARAAIQFWPGLRISSDIESATVCGVCCCDVVSDCARLMGMPTGTSLRCKKPLRLPHPLRCS